MSKIWMKALCVVSGAILAQLGGAAVAQEKTVTITASSNAGKMMAAPAALSREARLAAKPLDSSITIGKVKPRELSAEDKAALQAAKPELSDGGAPNASADDEARRDFSDEWKTMDQDQR